MTTYHWILVFFLFFLTAALVREHHRITVLECYADSRYTLAECQERMK